LASLNFLDRAGIQLGQFGKLLLSDFPGIAGAFEALPE
jgi:hypothetical protein